MRDNEGLELVTVGDWNGDWNEEQQGVGMEWGWGMGWAGGLQSHSRM